MAERTSWLAIEDGWKVIDRSGTTIGVTARVVGDTDADIFDGLQVRVEGGDELYVRAERVSDVREGRVQLDADRAELERAPAADAPGGVEVRRDRDAEL